jgi:hypothetical protein
MSIRTNNSSETMETDFQTQLQNKKIKIKKWQGVEK